MKERKISHVVNYNHERTNDRCNYGYHRKFLTHETFFANHLVLNLYVKPIMWF